MPSCVKLMKKKEQACIASMDHRIDIFFREITPPIDDSVDFDEKFINQRTVWASLDTRRGVEFFDDNNIMQRTTHRFIMRFIPNVTFTDFIVFKTIRYRLESVENLQEEDTFYQLDCVVRGTETLEVTKV